MRRSIAVLYYGNTSITYDVFESTATDQDPAFSVEEFQRGESSKNWKLQETFRVKIAAKFGKVEISQDSGGKALWARLEKRESPRRERRKTATLTASVRLALYCHL